MRLLLALALVGCCSGRNYWSLETGEEADSSDHGRSLAARSTNCSCGWTNKGRIVGGKETLVNEYPLVVALVDMDSRKPFCGGSLLTSKHVLSAAHCTQPMKEVTLSVLVGGHNLYKTLGDLYSGSAGDKAKLVGVERTIEHEEYNPDNYMHDIALVVLSSEVEFTQHVGPACLPTAPVDLTNQFIKVLGWGRLADNGVRSRTLQKVNLRVIPLKDCAARHVLPVDLQTPRQICTFRNGKDSCQGDSGGPLIWLDPDTNRYTLVALVSFGLDCASLDPAVNTDVAHYLPWIQHQIAKTGGGLTCAKV